jgi:predicted dehydrogenase
MHFFAGPIDTVCALGGRDVHSHGKSEAADVSAALSFSGGAAGTLHGTWALDFAAPLFDLVVNLKGGRIRMRGLDGELEVFDYAEDERETYGGTRNTSRWDWYKLSFKKSILAYIESVRKNTPPPVPGVWGLRELQVEAGLRRSIAQSRPVRLDTEFPMEDDVDA